MEYVSCSRPNEIYCASNKQEHKRACVNKWKDIGIVKTWQNNKNNSDLDLRILSVTSGPDGWQGFADKTPQFKKGDSLRYVFQYSAKNEMNFDEVRSIADYKLQLVSN